MSAQAGIWNFHGEPVREESLAVLRASVERLGPDGVESYRDTSIGMVYGAFHTTPESRLEGQPYRSPRGLLLTWDGRLDNRNELIASLRPDALRDSTDVALLSLAYERWGTDCFARIVGDWAATVWNPSAREMVFAVDYLAVRHLFYHLRNRGVRWSTDLAPLVLLSEDRLHLDEDYLAGYFTTNPASHRTPYRELQEVPAGHLVRVREEGLSVERYSRFNLKSKIRYKNDREYEEQFRQLFRQSVGRRLRSDSPVLCELSGGLDSSSIACMAHQIRLAEGGRAPRFDTLSLLNRTEPDGDDWIYIQKVEEALGCVGAHIDTGPLVGLPAPLAFPEFSPLPGRLGIRRPIEEERASLVKRGGYRVVLSGLGGDEFMGGIPDPAPQLGDLLVGCKFRTLGNELMAWSLTKRRPWMHLLWQALLALLPFPLQGYFGSPTRVEPWIAKPFVKRKRLASQGIPLQRGARFGSLAQRYYLGGLALMANKLAKHTPPALALEEARYPYLDQELIEFILAIPASQLLRPGERRSLQRRALANIVPEDVLSRRTKQFAARAPIAALEAHLEILRKEFQAPLSAHRGYIEGRVFLEKLEEASGGQKIHLTRMMRTIALEFWLRALTARGLLAEEVAA